MNRTIGTERLYTLGNYKNLKVTDVISDIPQELLGNSEVMSSLRMLQMLQSDKTYLQYLLNSATMQDLSGATPADLEELVETIDETRVATLEKLKEAFASQTNTEEKTE